MYSFVEFELVGPKLRLNMEKNQMNGEKIDKIVIGMN